MAEQSSLTLLTTEQAIDRAIAPLGGSALSEAKVAEHLAPLFARVLARNRERIYLANHSLGRPLDATQDDVHEALARWYAELGGAWDAWMAECDAYRARYAALLGATRSDSVVPKTSAGQGLRAVLASYERPPRVLATRGEFDSLDVILREHAHRGRLELAFVEPDGEGMFDSPAIADAIREGVDLVVLSPIMFATGQRVANLERIVSRAHGRGARVLLDLYHVLGVVPFDVAALDADFAVGGAYKYLRGGPGACFLYVAPRLLDAGLATTDIGWYAKDEPFAYERPDPPRLARGGDAWLESTPPILAWYQARAGQLFTLAIGVERLRAYSLQQQRKLIEALAARGIRADGAREDRGAFAVVRHPDAKRIAGALREQGVDVDARGTRLRLCPDVLTSSDELERAAAILASLFA